MKITTGWTRVPAAILASALALATASPASAVGFLEPDVQVLYTLTPDVPSGSFGFVGANIGDVTGDGIADFVIGAPQDQGSAFFGGRAYVYSGSDGSLLNIVGGGLFDFMGSAAAGLGDVNGDGVPDYAVGAPGLPPQFGAWPGRVLVISGADHTLIHETTSDPGDNYGFELSDVADVDGDGAADLLVGAPFDDDAGTDSGRAFLLSGATGAEIWHRDGQNAGDAFGGSLAGLPDLTGDGVSEVVAGAFNAGSSQGGNAQLLSGAGGASLHTFTPLASAVQFGQFFAEDAGDVDADGTDDIYVGDYADNFAGPLTGRAYLYSGATLEPIRVLDGEHVDDGFGIGRGAGDVNADGHADQFLAAFRSDDGAPNAGKAYLFSGRDGGVIRTFTPTGADNARLGFDALPLGDVNGDGIQDYLLTGVDVAVVVAGTDSSLTGRIDSLCLLIGSIPDDAFKAPADSRKSSFCNKLDAVRSQIANGDGDGAFAKLSNDISAKMDGALGGDPDDDWVTDGFWQDFLAPWIDGLARLATDG